MTGFEPVTSPLPRVCSTTELHGRGAGNGIRTRDPQLGRLMLYQLSYFRNSGGSRIRTCEGFPTDLQSVLVGRLSIPPGLSDSHLKSNIKTEPIVRFELTTPRLQITCSGQLSYIGLNVKDLAFLQTDCKCSKEILTSNASKKKSRDFMTPL